MKDELLEQAIATDFKHHPDYEIEYYQRAVAAYYKHVSSPEVPQQPSETDSGLAVHEGMAYMVLRNVNGVLAVYRIRKVDGVLKRLKRWPVEVEGTDRTAPSFAGIKTTGDLRTELANALLALDGSAEANKKAEDLVKHARELNKAMEANTRVTQAQHCAKARAVKNRD